MFKKVFGDSKKDTRGMTTPCEEIILAKVLLKNDLCGTCKAEEFDIWRNLCH